MTEASIDSNMTLREALKGSLAPQEVLSTLVIVDVMYVGFDGNVHHGQLVVNKDLQEDVIYIFEQLLVDKFPISKVVPIVAYDWDDHESIRDNNTSAFNYRNVSGTKRLSNHSFGRAIDINPLINPYMTNEGVVIPDGPEYDPSAKGAIFKGDKVTNLFLERGWEWDGSWEKHSEYIDYQHFQKIDP